MATGGGPRDLNVKLTLDTSHFTQNQQLLKSQLTALKSDFKSVAADSDFVGQSDALKQNLLDQMTAVETQIANYQLKLTALEGQLEGKEAGSKGESYILRQMNLVKSSISDSQTVLTSLEDQMKTFNAGNFAAAMQELSGVVNGLDMAYNTLLGGWAKDSADAAYEIATSREQATKEMYKIAGDDAGLEWLQQTEAQVRQAILEIPVTYEHFMEVMANAMQAGGQSYQNAYRFAEIFTKLESAAPTLAGDEGIAGFSRYLTLMDVQATEYEKIASVVVDLGNNFAVTEDQLVNTANRAASGLKSAGINAVDGLAVVAAALASGMNEAASATSLEKLSGNMAKGADVAMSSYGELLEMLKAYDATLTSAEAFKVAADIDSTVRKGFLSKYNLAGDDLDRMIKNARTAERFAETMGMTVQEYGEWYTSDPAKALVDFFGRLGQMNEEGSESILSYLDYLGITEVRASRLAKNFALSNNQVARALGISRDAAAEGVALQREYTAMGDAEVSNQVRRKNAQENALADLGDAVTAIRTPFQDFFSDVQQGFTNLPEWAKTAAGGLLEVFGGIGTVLSGVGDVAGGLYYSGELIKNVKSADWGKIGGGLKTVAGAVGKFALPVAAAAGIAALISTLDTMANDATAISNSLSNVQINVNEASKDAALAAIREVQLAADQLSGADSQEQLQQASRVVQTGYGDAELFGKGLGYEQAQMRKMLQETGIAYGLQIDEINRQILAASDRGDKALMETLAGQREVLRAQWEAETETIEDAYSGTVAALFNGMISQTPELEARLGRLGKGYTLLEILTGLSAGTIQRSEVSLKRAVEDMYALGVIDTAAYERYWQYGELVQGEAMYAGFEAERRKLLEMLTKETEAALGNGEISALLASAFEGGIFDDVDFSQISGAFSGLLAAAMLRTTAEGGAETLDDFGKNIVSGLGGGISGNVDLMGQPAEDLKNATLAAIKTAFDIHSPAGTMVPLGNEIVNGLAAGILAQESAAVAAIRQIGAAMQAEAAAQAGRISALLQLGGYGVSAGLQGGYNAPAGGSSQITNHFNISAGSLAEQQSVISLADRIQRIQYRTNAGVGKFK